MTDIWEKGKKLKLLLGYVRTCQLHCTVVSEHVTTKYNAKKTGSLLTEPMDAQALLSNCICFQNTADTVTIVSAI